MARWMLQFAQDGVGYPHLAKEQPQDIGAAEHDEVVEGGGIGHDKPQRTHAFSS
jgi:hypothetical protein